MGFSYEEQLNEGIALMESGDIKSAADRFRKCTEVNPDTAEAHFRLGGALAELGKLAEALEAYKKGVLIDPKDAEAFTAVGDIHFEEGH